MQSTTLMKWCFIYAVIEVLGIAAMETSTSIFTRVPSFLLTTVTWIIIAKLWIRFVKAEKREREDERKKELEEHLRKERIRSFYKD